MNTSCGIRLAHKFRNKQTKVKNLNHTHNNNNNNNNVEETNLLTKNFLLINEHFKD